MSKARYFIFSVLVVGICFANSLPDDFILDDYHIVAANPAIRTLSPAHFFVTPYWGKKGQVLEYRPVTMLSFALEYPLWHRWAGGYRLGNLFIHSVNGLLVFVLARGLLQSTPAALAAAALYLVHPVHTEAVVGLVGRSELLAAMFFLLAWILFRQKRTFLCSVAFFLGLLSKENTIAFPMVIALDTWISEGGFKKAFAQWKRFAPVAVAACAYLVVRRWVLGAILIPHAAQYFAGRAGLLERELTSSRALLKYLQLLAAPVTVTGDYGFNSIPIAHAGDWDAWAALVLAAAIIVFALRAIRKRPSIALAILFSFITLLPVSNWIVPTSWVMAERFLYLPSLGICLIGATIWAGIADLRVKTILAAGVMAAAILLCISHNYVWRNDLTFYGNLVRVFPENLLGRQGYGFALFNSGRFRDARAQFEAGLRISRDPELLAGLAASRMALEGGCGQAHPLLDEALGIQPDYYFGRWLAAHCFAIEGKFVEAEEAFHRAANDAWFPDPRLFSDWGRSLEKLGRSSEALAAYSRGTQLYPDDPLLLRDLSRLATQQ